MCDYLGINIKATAAESPWINSVLERTNQTIAKMMDKIISDTTCSPELALTWALNAKNNNTHNNTTTYNKITYSHHLQQITLYCPHTVMLVLAPILNSN